MQFQIYQVHDPCTPLKVQHGIFTRWNKGKQGLDFYNGVLRRILPGKDPGELDIFRFSVDEPIEIVQPIGEGLVRKEVDYEAR